MDRIISNYFIYSTEKEWHRNQWLKTHINSVAHKAYPPILRCECNVALVGIKTLVE